MDHFGENYAMFKTLDVFVYKAVTAAHHVPEH